VNAAAVAIAAVAAVALAMRGRRGRRGGSVAPQTDGQGWTAVRDLALEPAAVAVLDRIGTAAAAEGIPVTATSGRRDPARQAAAMLAKVARGEDLRALYRDKGQIDRLLSLPRDVAAWAAEIARSAAAGRPLSSHLSGRAFDLRTRDLSDRQVARLVEIAAAAGRRAILEPDHIHVEA
jgi:hypothetical protein